MYITLQKDIGKVSSRGPAGAFCVHMEDALKLPYILFTCSGFTYFLFACRHHDAHAILTTKIYRFRGVYRYKLYMIPFCKLYVSRSYIQCVPAHRHDGHQNHGRCVPG
jgi:hypothetical protein